MEQNDIILTEIAQCGRAAFRRLVRAGRLTTDHQVRGTNDDVDVIAAHIIRHKRQLRVELRLQRAAPWAFAPARYASLLSHLATLLEAQSVALNKHRPDQRPPPET